MAIHKRREIFVMPNTTANGIQIEYETLGERPSPPLLLIMGLSAQMIGWEEEFCKRLVEKGLFVIRFDNRDVGLSTKFEEAGIPDIVAAMQGQEFQAAYSLDDMADDAVGLLDALGIEKAHICGVSMGAMITQVIGYRHPSRVLSLIPIMGSTGNPALPRAKPEAFKMLITPAPEEREAYIEYSVIMWKVFWGSLHFDEDIVRKRAAVSYDRVFYPQGIARQHAAIISNGNRKSRLASITAPTLVIHGSEDPLLPIEHGKDTAEAIPDAEMLIIGGMGHCLPKIVWPQIVDAIANQTNKAAHSLD
jgi:pimeloyl-ACP methyl ester carboxylesterase